jgi:hypothetical protein
MDAMLVKLETEELMISSMSKEKKIQRNNVC